MYATIPERSYAERAASAASSAVISLPVIPAHSRSSSTYWRSKNRSAIVAWTVDMTGCCFIYLFTDELYTTHNSTCVCNEQFASTVNSINAFYLLEIIKSVPVLVCRWFVCADVVLFSSKPCSVKWNLSNSYHLYRVPRDDPSGQSVVLPTQEFKRILNASRVLTPEERMAQIQELQSLKKAAEVCDDNVFWNSS